MAKTLPSSWAAQLYKVHATQPFVWAWEFILQQNESVNTVARLVPYPTEITVASKTFSPFPLTMSQIEETSEGDLPQLEISASNVGRLLMQYFETPADGEGIIGSTATGYLFTLDDLTASQTYEFRVASATANDDSVTLRLELPNFFQRKVPQDRYNPQRCRWRFGGSECGYIVNGVAAYTTCSKLVDDCILRGDDEVARNLPRLHPDRFGGFLGIPRL